MIGHNYNYMMYAVAELCKAFGMSVWGVTRTKSDTKCPYVDHHR